MEEQHNNDHMNTYLRRAVRWRVEDKEQPRDEEGRFQSFDQGHRGGPPKPERKRNRVARIFGEDEVAA